MSDLRQVFETPWGRVILYLTGLHHAEEIFATLMLHRESIAATLIKIAHGYGEIGK